MHFILPKWQELPKLEEICKPAVYARKQRKKAVQKTSKTARKNVEKCFEVLKWRFATLKRASLLRNISAEMEKVFMHESAVTVQTGFSKFWEKLINMIND